MMANITWIHVLCTIAFGIIVVFLNIKFGDKNKKSTHFDNINMFHVGKGFGTFVSKSNQDKMFKD